MKWVSLSGFIVSMTSFGRATKLNHSMIVMLYLHFDRLANVKRESLERLVKMTRFLPLRRTPKSCNLPNCLSSFAVTEMLDGENI